jgi:hypothetical protein
MEKSKLLPVIAAIMITSMAVSMLSFSTTTVSATHDAPTATITPTRVRANDEKLFTITVTNTGGDKIDNVKITQPSGFSGLTSTATIAAGDNIYLGPVTGENRITLKAGTVVMLYENAQIGLYENTVVIRAAGENIYIENNAGTAYENGKLIDNLSIKLLQAVTTTTDATGLDNTDNVQTALIRTVTLSGGYNENVVAVLAATTVVKVSDNVYRFADNTDVKILSNILVKNANFGLLNNDNVVTTVDRGIVVNNGRSTNPSAFTCLIGSTVVTMPIAAGAILGLGLKNNLDNRVILLAGTTVRLVENVQVRLGKDTTVSKTAGENITSLTAVTKPENWTFDGKDTWTTTVADRMIAAGGSKEFTFAATTPTAGGDKTFTVTTEDNSAFGTANRVRTMYVTPDVFVDNVSPVVTSVTVSKTWAKDNDAVVITVVASEAIVPSDSWVAVAESNAPENTQVSMTSSDNITWTGTYTTGDNVLRDGVATIFVVNDNFKDLVDHSGSGENIIGTLKVDRRNPPIPSTTYGGLTKLTTPINQSSQTITVYAFDNRYDNNAANGIYGNVAGMTVKIRMGTTTVNRTADSTGKVMYLITLSEGSNEVGVSFVDLAGNESENENVQTVICDTVKPSISITSPAAGAIINDNTPLITLTITDATLGVENENYTAGTNSGYRVELRRNDNTVIAELKNSQPHVKNTLAFENTYPTELVDNRYNIYVIAGDNLQSDNTYFSFTIDTQAPTWTQAQLLAAVTLKDPTTLNVLGTTTKKTSWLISGGAWKPGSTINVYVSASPPILKGTATASTTLNNNTGLYDYSLTIELSEGVGKSVFIEEVDTASNTSGQVLFGTYTVDTTPPVIALSAPADDTTTDAAQITVSGTITDAIVTDPQILIVTIDCTGASVAKTVYPKANGSFETTVPLIEGINKINVVAADGAVTATSGNQAITTRTVTRTVTPLTTYAIILVVVALILAAIAIFRKEMKK